MFLNQGDSGYVVQGPEDTAGNKTGIQLCSC